MVLGTKTALEMGLRVVERRGFWDMPVRKSPVNYQWGDELQPLVDEEDISYQPLQFEVDFLFDPRITVGTNPGQSAETAMEFLMSQRTFVLDLEYPFGSVSDKYVRFDVRVSEFKNYKRYPEFKNFNNDVTVETFTAVFVNEDPQFFRDDINFDSHHIDNVFVTYPTDGGSPEVGYFSVILKSLENENGLSGIDRVPTSFAVPPQTKIDQATKKISADFLLVSPDSDGQQFPVPFKTIRELAQFKGFLSRPGLKRMQYTKHGRTAIEFYVTEGFSVKEYNRGREMEFTLTMDLVRWL